MSNNVMDNLYNVDDKLGVQLYGPRRWNALKGRVCGTTAAMLEHPERSAARPININRPYDELFTKLFRPDVRAGAELLGGGWVERVEDSTLGDVSETLLNIVNSDKFKVGSDIFHNAANIFQYVPGYGQVVPAARKVTNTAADILTSLGFGTSGEKVASAAKTGGLLLLLGGGGFAVWYFGFRKKRRGRK